MTTTDPQVYLPPTRSQRLIGLGAVAVALAGAAIHIGTDLAPENNVMLRIATATVLGLGAVAVALAGAAIHIGTDLAPENNVMLRIATATVLGLGSIATAMFAGRLAREKVIVDGQGIVIHTRRTMRRLRWAEIASIGLADVDSAGVPTTDPVDTLLCIHCVDGRVIRFSETLGVPVGRADCVALADIAIRATADRLLRRSIARFEAGRSVKFGRLTVKPAGLAVDDQLLTWNEYADLRIDRRSLQLMRRGSEDPWRSVPSGELRNDAILRPFLEQVLRLRRGAAMSAVDPWQAVVEGGK